jgi:hypothetical protein
LKQELMTDASRDVCSGVCAVATSLFQGELEKPQKQDCVKNFIYIYITYRGSLFIIKPEILTMPYVDGTKIDLYSSERCDGDEMDIGNRVYIWQLGRRHQRIRHGTWAKNKLKHERKEKTNGRYHYKRRQ